MSAKDWSRFVRFYRCGEGCRQATMVYGSLNLGTVKVCQRFSARQPRNVKIRTFHATASFV
jgi:hypothetical protein